MIHLVYFSFFVFVFFFFSFFNFLIFFFWKKNVVESSELKKLQKTFKSMQQTSSTQEGIDEKSFAKHFLDNESSGEERFHIPGIFANHLFSAFDPVSFIFLFSLFETPFFLHIKYFFLHHHRTEQTRIFHNG